MVSDQITYTLNNGAVLPAVGLGVLQMPEQETISAVQTALQAGYRMIDTAEAYGNEAGVGEGLRRSGVARGDVFVQTKRFPGGGKAHDYDSTIRAFEASIDKLGVDYVDSYLIHWPIPMDFDGTIHAWKAMEKLAADGRIRSLGVSNFTADHLARLAEASDTVPVVNQIELHPYFTQSGMRDTDADRGIITQAWSPLGGVYTYLPNDQGQTTQPIENPAITQIADAHQKSAGQVVLRWHLQHGIAVIPKSVRKERIEANLDVFDFTLTDAEVATIDALDTGMRGGPDPDTMAG